MKYVQYGDRRMPLEDGMTKEQAKEILQRFFPELGDPAIETKKEGEDVVYIFTKRAGRKGRGGPRSARRSRVLTRLSHVLARLDPAPPIPPWAIHAAETFDVSILSNPALERQAEQLAAGLAAEAARVRTTVSALRDVPSVPSESVSLL